jgi:hypothetical protein
MMRVAKSVLLLVLIVSAVTMLWAGCTARNAAAKDGEAQAAPAAASKPAAPAPAAAPKPSPPAERNIAEWLFYDTPREDWKAEFPTSDVTKREEYGAVFAVDSLEPSGPELTELALDAAKIARVRLHAFAEDRGKLEVGIVEARLGLNAVYIDWARADDVDEDGKPVYSDERSLPLERDEDTRYDWVGALSEHPLWNGEISQVRLRYVVDHDAVPAGGLNIVVRRITLVAK